MNNVNKKEILVMTYEQWEILHDRRIKRRRKKLIREILNAITEFLVYFSMALTPVLLVIIWIMFGYI